MQVPAEDTATFDAFLDTLGYPYVEETNNPAYRLFPAQGILIKMASFQRLFSKRKRLLNHSTVNSNRCKACATTCWPCSSSPASPSRAAGCVGGPARRCPRQQWRNFPALAGWPSLSCAVLPCCIRKPGAAAAGPAGGCVFCTITTVLITGGFHDGLADGRMPGRQRPNAEALDIMKRLAHWCLWRMAFWYWRCWPITPADAAGRASLAALAALAGPRILAAVALFIVCGGCRMWVTRPIQSKPLATRFHAAPRLAAALWCFLPSGSCPTKRRQPSIFIASITASMFAACADGALVCAPPGRLTTGDCLGATCRW